MLVVSLYGADVNGMQNIVAISCINALSYEEDLIK